MADGMSRGGGCDGHARVEAPGKAGVRAVLGVLEERRFPLVWDGIPEEDERGADFEGGLGRVGAEGRAWESSR